MPHVPHSGESNGKTRGFDWYARCRRIKRKRERRRDRETSRTRRIITRGGEGGERGLKNTADGGRLETALVKNGYDNDDRGPINYRLRAYLA